MVDIITKGDPLAVEDIPRDFIPDEVREWDLDAYQCATLGIMVPPELLHWGNYRVCAVYAVSKADANRVISLYSILGPGTGEGAVTMAPADWAWVQDWRDSRPEQIRQRLAAKAARLTDWNQRMTEGLVREAHEQEQRKHATTTVGYGGMTQRS